MEVLLAENEDHCLKVASSEVFKSCDAEVLEVEFLHLPGHKQHDMWKLLSSQDGKGIHSEWILELELDL